MCNSANLFHGNSTNIKEYKIMNKQRLNYKREWINSKRKSLREQYLKKRTKEVLYSSESDGYTKDNSNNNNARVSRVDFKSKKY